MYKIYKHTLKEGFEHSGWSYIGLSDCEDIESRWRNGRGYCEQRFGKAINKYGWENFSHEILEDNIETLELANKREQYWIAYYHTWVKDPQCNGYNLTIGGDATHYGGTYIVSKNNQIKRITYLELDSYVADGWLWHGSKEYDKIRCKKNSELYKQRHSKEEIAAKKHEYYLKNKKTIKQNVLNWRTTKMADDSYRLARNARARELYAEKAKDQTYRKHLAELAKKYRIQKKQKQINL